MKKFIAIILTLLLLSTFAACGNKDSSPTTTKQNAIVPSSQEETTKSQVSDMDYESIPDTMTSENGKYEVAFVTDVGELKDKSFNQGSWNGVKKFAKENGKSYKYYKPGNGDKATDEDRYEAMKTAVDSGAEIVICTGFIQGTPLSKIAKEFKDTKFVFVDGSILTEDGSADSKPLQNVAAVDYREEESGFLAGYAAVMEGYTKLGFTGGGAGTNPPCNRFGYGFVQGAEEAAKMLNKEIEMKFSWEYGASFTPSPELQTMLDGWYSNGTEIIFCCGGAMCQSAFAAAAANEGKVIGVDVDQSSQSDTVITSATKGIRESVELMLQKFYDDKWDEVGGKLTTLGAKDNAVGLPKESWKMKSFSYEDYEKLFEKMKNGEIKVDRDYDKGLKKESFTKVKLNIV